MRYTIKGHDIYNDEMEILSTDRLDIAKEALRDLFHKQYGMEENILTFFLYDNSTSEKIHVSL